MSGYSWASVEDAVPAITRHCVDAMCGWYFIFTTTALDGHLSLTTMQSVKQTCWSRLRLWSNYEDNAGVTSISCWFHHIAATCLQRSMSLSTCFTLSIDPVCNGQLLQETICVWHWELTPAVSRFSVHVYLQSHFTLQWLVYIDSLNIRNFILGHFTIFRNGDVFFKFECWSCNSLSYGDIIFHEYCVYNETADIYS